MKIKKILIIPIEQLVPSNEFFLRRLARFVKYGFKLPLFYSGELQMYGDIPKILGKEQTFILGKYNHRFFSKHIPEQCAYPSCYGTPEGTVVTQRGLDNVLSQVDAILISISANKKIIETVVKKARAKDIPIAMIDFYDHEKLYGASEKEKRKNMFRGFLQKKDFDLYFKKDLHLGYKTKKVLPLAPVPIRPESYRFETIPKDKTIFYSGRSRPDLCQPDRIETTDLIGKNFSNTLILKLESQDSFMNVKEYWYNLSRAQMALSPSGRVWDSFRHCEVGLAPLTCLIAPRPYVETVKPYLRDGKNAILYDTKLREDKKYHLVNPSALIEKIRYYLDHPNECQNLAQAWQTNVLEDHTIFARSKYIIESMEKVFS